MRSALLLLAACGPRPAPEAAAPASVEVPPEPTVEIPGPSTPDECLAEARAAGVLHPEDCRDADCGEGRSCASVPPLSVCDAHPLRVCLAPGDPCTAEAPCPEGTWCGHVGGQAICGGMVPGPP